MHLLQVTVPFQRGSSPPPEPIIQDLPIIINDEDAILDDAPPLSSYSLYKPQYFEYQNQSLTKDRMMMIKALFPSPQNPIIQELAITININCQISQPPQVSCSPHDWSHVSHTHAPDIRKSNLFPKVWALQLSY